MREKSEERNIYPKVCVVIPAKNSSKYIRKTIFSLKQQTIQPVRIIVVDDGSSDNTAEIARSLGADVIRLPDIGIYAVGTPHLALVINKGLKECLRCRPDFILIAGSDDVFPPYYIEKLYEKFKQNRKLAIASGYVIGEPWNKSAPRGGGRMIKVSALKRIGLYPYNYGWETYLLFKARMLGYDVCAYKIAFLSQRSSVRNPIKYYFIGKGMRALGYTILYTIGRVLLLVFRGKSRHAILMLKGYLSKVKVYDDVKDYVKYLQCKKMLSIGKMMHSIERITRTIITLG